MPAIWFLRWHTQSPPRLVSSLLVFILAMMATTSTISAPTKTKVQESTTGVHDGSKCADKGGDCCASKEWGEPQACKDGYIPVPTDAKHCPSTNGCAKISNGKGCYGCYAPKPSGHTTQPSHTGVHDGSKCADKGGDCCASKDWGEPQACKDGYIPVHTDAKHCPSAYKGCAKISNGKGCYGCYAPTPSGHTTQPSRTGVHDGSKCADKGGDCCASKDWGEPQACKDGYIPMPVDAKHCPSTNKRCAKISNGKGCYGCFAPWSSAGDVVVVHGRNLRRH